jgi:hypothetical protein
MPLYQKDIWPLMNNMINFFTSVRTGYADELNYEDVEENFKLINEPFKVPVQ